MEGKTPRWVEKAGGDGEKVRGVREKEGVVGCKVWQACVSGGCWGVS